MNAPRKKSFFELLTGSSQPEEKIATQDTGKEESVAFKKDLKQTEMPGPQKRDVIKPAKNGPFTHEELAAEEEGQLTIDVYQTENEIVIKSPVAGVSSDDLDVSISNDMITIKGRRENDERIPDDDFYFQELYWGPFSRSVILPTEVEADKVRASLKNGILTVRLPKIKRETIKKVEIRAE